MFSLLILEVDDSTFFCIDKSLICSTDSRYQYIPSGSSPYSSYSAENRRTMHTRRNG
jgi:hypothetical protein